MDLLTRKYFEKEGCQFQKIGSGEKGQLYVTQWLGNGDTNLCVVDYAFACEYGLDGYLNVSRVIFIDDQYFVMNYKILGEIEVVKRYYDEYMTVNYPKRF